MKTKKALILWISRDQSKSWGRLGILTVYYLNKRLRYLLGILGVVVIFAGIGLAVAILVS